VSLIDRLAGVTAKDIWEYHTRRLTERFAIIERVPPRYDSSLTLVFRGKRVVRANTRFIGVSNDVLVVGVEDNELIRRATETILKSGFNPAPMKDSDDNTYANTGALSARTGIVRYDLGSVMNVVILLVVAGSGSTANCYLAVSNDNVTYTDLISYSGTTKTTYVVSATARYIRLDGADPTNFAYACWFYTLEAYKATSTPDVIITDTVVRTLTVISRGYSQLLEVVQF
jgi:hypothetical protein